MKRAFRRRGTLIGLVGVMFTGFSLIAGVAGIAGSAAAASGVPYTDTRAVGSIGLCTAAGQAITKGSIHDVPFVTKAIDSTPAAAPYNGPGETATLFIYQPRQSVQPAEWHGEQLGASSRSSTPQHPTAIMTAGDGPLAAALADYPPQWDGFMQLRIFLGAPNQPIYNSTYDATDIKITGDTWQVVRGDSVPCGNGQSVSLEQVLASSFPQLTASPSSSGSGAAANPGGRSPGASGKPGSATSAGTGATASGDTSAGPSAPVSGSAEGSTGPGGGAAGGGSGGSHGGSSPVLWILIAVGVVGVGVAAVQWSRSRPVGTRRA